MVRAGTSRIWKRAGGITVAGKRNVPEISRFFGIVIGMYYEEHGRPHFHARAGSYRISVEIESGVVRGEFPVALLRHVLDWADLHRRELLENWELARQGAALHPIEPLQ
jgi:hypothetical protein